MKLERFQFVVETLGVEDLDGVRAVLREEEEQALLILDDERRKILERHRQINASMMHRLLDIPLPESVDQDHARALIVYGFVAPSTSRTFAGVVHLPWEHVRDDVRNKLGGNFSPEKLEQAHRYLVQQGVMRGSSRGKSTLLVSMNLKEQSATDEGRRIIQITKRFMHGHRPGRNGGH
ncbi:MAG: hypothetical protein AAB864_01025 [Patescibacteria group bacterium]